MGRNLLLNRIREIQTEYKDLLSNIIDDFEGLYRSAALDEIVLFWTKNKPVVNMFLRHSLSNEDTFIMTAVTYLDIAADEQYPFFLAGSFHILDDPLGKYCEICNTIEEEYEMPLGAEILKCARDDLRVLIEYPQIIVIPMRLFKENEKQEVLKEASEQLFISLFSEISSIEEYFDKIKSVDDIAKSIKGFEHSILLNDEDDSSLPIPERFEKTRIIMKEWFPNDVTDAQLFFYVITSYLSQAIDIILSCSEFHVIPYIRYNLALHYYLLCAEVFERESEIDCKTKLVCIGNLLYKIADCDKLKNKGDKKFFEIIEKNNFWINLKNETQKVNVELGTVKKIASIIEKHLNCLYSEIEKE